MEENKKRIYSWAFYDWANSAYSTTVMAGFFPIFYEKFYSNPNDVIQSTYQLGLANSISSVFIALVSPLLGAIADRGSPLPAYDRSAWRLRSLPMQPFEHCDRRRAKTPRKPGKGLASLRQAIWWPIRSALLAPGIVTGNVST